MQNYLENFTDADAFATATRVAVLWQLATVYPLLLGIVRQQFYGTVLNIPWPGRVWVGVLNLVVLGGACTTATFFPEPGSVLSYTGAVCGSVYVIILPITVHIRKSRKDGVLTTAAYYWHVVLVVVGVGCFAAGPF